MVLTKQDVKLASVICAPRWRRPRLRGLGVRIDDVGFEWNAQGDAPGGPETQGRQKGGAVHVRIVDFMPKHLSFMS